ncbi:MAG TPA: hypothetical protein PLV68_11420 [Ilumatobacteraceae bacterium]|nr:hypothetical protein [Ilumatobacteraceae bacterium]
MSASEGCELCEAARITPWYRDDELCWIAECEFCDVPMVVLRHHTATPGAAVRRLLHQRLIEAVLSRPGTAEAGSNEFASSWWIDDNMRNIPSHYHAHARRRRG